jgi:hypothetical protein
LAVELELTWAITVMSTTQPAVALQLMFFDGAITMCVSDARLFPPELPQRNNPLDDLTSETLPGTGFIPSGLLVRPGGAATAANESTAANIPDVINRHDFRSFMIYRSLERTQCPRGL